MKRHLFLFILILSMVCGIAAAESTTDVRVMVRNGGSFVFALDDTGTVWGWGDNTKGQLGKDDRKYYRAPVQVADGLDGHDILDIQCGNENTLYLMKDGTVFTSGTGNHGTQGLGRKKASSVGAPRQIPGLENIIQVSCGFGHNAVLDADGHVWTWGRNSSGQLGNRSRVEAYEPVMIELENIIQVTCGGKFCLALDTGGNVWGWGANTYGVLAKPRDNNKYISKPVLLDFLSGMKLVELAGGSDCGFALDTNGILWAWGRNDYSQVGNSKAKGESILPPVQVELPEGTHVRRVIGYSSHVMCITDTNDVYVWGSVSAGQLGNGKAPQHSFPVLSYSGEEILDADIGSLICTILTGDGVVHVTGYNKYGQIGDGGTKSARRWSTANGLNVFTGK